eukprot:g18217.t1
MVPPKPRALAVPTAAEENAEAEEVPAPPTPEEEEEASLAAVEKYRSNLRLWKSRASLAVEPLPEAAVGRRLVAELSGAPAAAASGAVGPEAAAQMRQALTRQLLQSLASSMQSDAATLEDRLSQLETMRWSAER